MKSRLRLCYGRLSRALRVEVSTGIFRPGENEATTANLTQAFTGLLGHGVNHFDVTHTKASPWKGENGTGKHRDTGRQRSEPEEERASQPPRLVTSRGFEMGWLAGVAGARAGLPDHAHLPSGPRVLPMNSAI